MIKEKICTCCKIKKNINCFYNDKNRKDGLRVYCKECEKEKNKKYLIRDSYIKIEKKICSTCGKEKNINEFPERKDSPDGRRNDCKECKRISDKNYALNNKEKIRNNKKLYYENNKNEILIKQKEKNSKEENKIKINSKRKEKKQKDPLYKLKCNLRSYISYKVKKNKNGCFSFLNYRVIDLYNILLERFKCEKDIFDKCLLSGEYHIDHIIPISMYKYNNKTDNEFLKCWNYRNFRLIKKDENLRKGNKFYKELVEEYNIQDLMPEEKND